MGAVTKEYAMRLRTLGPEPHMKGCHNQVPFLGPYDKLYDNLGSILGPSYRWKLPYTPETQP